MSLEFAETLDISGAMLYRGWTSAGDGGVWVFAFVSYSPIAKLFISFIFSILIVFRLFRYAVSCDQAPFAIDRDATRRSVDAMKEAGIVPQEFNDISMLWNDSFATLK